MKGSVAAATTPTTSRAETTRPTGTTPGLGSALRPASIRMPR
ncbi:hypothetical protein [Nocardioides sp. B-3]|nr:hypothetical protein [Nocardioides sp. B-3]